MTDNKRTVKGARLAGLVVAVLGGLAVVSFAKSLTVYNTNNTTKQLSGSDCISANCKSFTVASHGTSTQQVVEPSSGTATLIARFALSSSTSVVVASCSSSFSVATSSFALVNVNSSSNTYNCAVQVY